MEIAAWSWALLLTKVFVYAGMAAAVGGSFVAWLTGRADLSRQYGIVLLTLALLASGANFLVQVGALADRGVAGIVDGLMLDILWQSNARLVLLLRMVGFSLLLVLTVFLHAVMRRPAMTLVLIFGAALIGLTFPLVGHTVEQGLAPRVLLAVHTLAIAWWLGSLWPLHRACRQLPTPALQQTMTRFSRVALWTVAILLVSGLAMAWQLLASWQDLVATSYGRLLLAKTALVAGMLGFAAWNKTVLTPRLATDDRARHLLSNSIRGELVLGLLILAVTAFLSSQLGPGH